MVFLSNKTRQSLPRFHLLKITKYFLKERGRAEQELSLVFVDSEFMRQLNLKYRGLNETTDILSFPVLEASLMLGEVFINLEALNDLSSYQEIIDLLEISTLKPKKKIKILLDFILIHGLLHLLGYDDQDPQAREEMLQVGKDFLGKYGIIKK